MKKTQRNDVGQKIAKRMHGSHIAKIVAAAKESAIATAVAVQDYRKTCEVETLAQAAKTCRAALNEIVAQLTAEHDRALAFRNEMNDVAYQSTMRWISDKTTPQVQTAEATLRAVNDKLMRAGLEITAERWDLLAAGVNHRVRGCDHRLALVEKALGNAKPQKPRAKKTATKYVEL